MHNIIIKNEKLAFTLEAEKLCRGIYLIDGNGFDEAVEKINFSCTANFRVKKINEWAFITLESQEAKVLFCINITADINGITNLLSSLEDTRIVKFIKAAHLLACALTLEEAFLLLEEFETIAQ